MALGYSIANSQAAPTPAPTPPELPALVEKLGQTSDEKEQDAGIEAHREIEGKTLRSALIDRAYLLTMQGEYSRAERLARLLERLAHAANDPADVARAQIRLANVFQEYGEYPQALAQLDEALRYLGKNPEGVTIVGAYQGKGIAYLYEGDFAGALRNFERAHALAEERNFPEGQTAALNSMGEVFREEGLPERALEYYVRARATVKGDDAPPLAFIFNNMGQAYEALGELDKAVEFINRARDVAEKSKMRPRVAASLAILGKISAAQQKWPEADDLFAQSLALSRELKDVFGEGRAHLGRADVALGRGDPKLAAQEADEAVQIFRKILRPDWMSAALTARGRALLALHEEDGARAAFEEAITAIESLRGNVAGTETEAEAFLESRLAPYQELIALLDHAGETQAALLLSERASANVILAAITRGGGSALSQVALTAPEAERRRELAHRVADLGRELTKSLGDEKKRAAVEAELREAQHAEQTYAAELSAAHPELQRAAPQPLTSLEPLQKLIAQGETALLKFSLGNESSLLFVLSDGLDGKTKLQSFSVPLSRVSLNKLANRFRGRVADRSLLWKEDARSLFDALLGSSRAAWQNAHNLVIVPDGELWQIPFQALLDEEERPLLEHASVSYAPSLSVLARLEERSHSSPPSNLLAFGNPALPKQEAEGALPALPVMEKQVRALGKIYAEHNPKIYVGREANEQTADREMPTASVIHFATHGVLNNRGPLYSYLLLSQEDSSAEEDGLLHAWEIMHLHLQSQLAVLCGCETARGRASPGEGVIGFSWALFVAGCPATVVTQWKVDEASSTPLMLAFHERMLRDESKAQALREAALELRKEPRYRHPFFWAPFVLIGDPR